MAVSGRVDLVGDLDSPLSISEVEGRQVVEDSSEISGSTISTLLHDKTNPKDCQVLSLGDLGFLQFFGVVSSDYGKPWISAGIFAVLLLKSVLMHNWVLWNFMTPVVVFVLLGGREH